MRRKGALGWVALIMLVAVATVGLAAPAIARWMAHRKGHRCCMPREGRFCRLAVWGDGRLGCEVNGPCCCSFGLSHHACGCSRSAYSTCHESLEIGPEPDNGPAPTDSSGGPK